MADVEPLTGLANDPQTKALLSALSEATGTGSAPVRLPDLLQRLRAGGLDGEVQSWIGTGANLPVTPEQIQHALGGELMDRIAVRLRMGQRQAAAQIAAGLPEVVNQASRDGRLPDPHALDAALREATASYPGRTH